MFACQDLGLKKKEIEDISFAFDVYHFQGDGTSIPSMPPPLQLEPTHEDHQHGWRRGKEGKEYTFLG